MAKLFSSSQFDIEWAKYVFNPEGGKNHQGAFVLQEGNLSCPHLNPPIVLVYGASKVFRYYLERKRDFKLNLRVDGKSIAKSLTGVLNENDPNEEYYEKVGKMRDRAKEYYQKEIVITKS